MLWLPGSPGLVCEVSLILNRASGHVTKSKHRPGDGLSPGLVLSTLAYFAIACAGTGSKRAGRIEYDARPRLSERMALA